MIFDRPTNPPNEVIIDLTNIVLSVGGETAGAGVGFRSLSDDRTDISAAAQLDGAQPAGE